MPPPPSPRTANKLVSRSQLVSRILSSIPWRGKLGVGVGKRAIISEGQIVIVDVVVISAAKTRFVFTAAEMITLVARRYEVRPSGCRSISHQTDHGQVTRFLPRRRRHVGYLAAKFKGQGAAAERVGHPTEPCIQVSFQTHPWNLLIGQCCI